MLPRDADALEQISTGIGYNVVATSHAANQKLTASRDLVFLEGDIGKQQTAIDAVEQQSTISEPSMFW